MNFWQRGVSFLDQLATKVVRNPAALARLEERSGGNAARVARAISAAGRSRRSEEEESWIDRIESVRAAVNSRVDLVSLRLGCPQSDGATETEPARTVPLGRHSLLSSKRKRWCLFLFHLVRELEPDACLELGTCVGISGSYQAAALELNGHGKLYTLEGASGVAAVAASHFEELGLSHRVEPVVGRFQETLAAVLDSSPELDLVFVDGHHDERATWEYYQKILPHVRDGGVILFDDIDWTPGMKRVWRRIRRDSGLAVSIDMTKIGVGLVDSSAEASPQLYKAAI